MPKTRFWCKTERWTKVFIKSVKSLKAINLGDMFINLDKILSIFRAEKSVEVCLKNIRTEFFVHGKEYSYRKNIKCYFNCNSKIIGNNFFIAFTSRAPPSILL